MFLKILEDPATHWETSPILSRLRKVWQRVKRNRNWLLEVAYVQIVSFSHGWTGWTVQETSSHLHFTKRTQPFTFCTCKETFLRSPFARQSFMESVSSLQILEDISDCFLEPAYCQFMTLLSVSLSANFLADQRVHLCLKYKCCFY